MSSLIVSRYSTKLRALSDAQVEDFGAKLAVERTDIVPDAVRESRASSSLSDFRSTSVGSSSTFEGFDRPGSLNSSDRLGLGEFLREVEAQNGRKTTQERGRRSAMSQMDLNCGSETDSVQRAAGTNQVGGDRQSRRKRRRFGWNQKLRSACERIDKNRAPFWQKYRLENDLRQ